MIRKKTFGYLLVTFLLMTFVSLLTYYNARIFSEKIKSLFISNVQLTNIYKDVGKVQTSMKNYLSTGHSRNLVAYLRYSHDLRIKTDNFKVKISDSQSQLLLDDIYNMISTYLDESDDAVTEKRGRNISGYNNEYNQAKKIYDYIDSSIDELKIDQFQENLSVYLKLNSRTTSMQLFNFWVILCFGIINILLIIWLSFSITEPIIRLSRSANEIALGNYDIPDVLVESNDEMGTLAAAFNHMKASVKNHVIAIREKARVETQLREQEVQNFKIRSLLKETELRSLQSQINPHFIFNTMNAGMQIAMFEGAENTQRFMENLSELMRYNLGSYGHSATLRQEIDNIDRYIYLLKIRFADRIQYEKSIDDRVLDCPMPRMILQPIVENAFIHGISEQENGGLIQLRAAQSGQTIVVDILDNGCGMDQQTIDRILADTDDGVEQTGNSIGLKNVVNRLRIFYQSADVLKIESLPRTGTKVSLFLPADRAENNWAETLGRKDAPDV